MYYPWHHAQWQKITTIATPHALLLTGEEGIGKRAFALYFAQYLLCENKQEHTPCGTCAGCQWFLEGNHPDFKILSPQEDDAAEEGKKRSSQWITVESIRMLADFVYTGAHRRGNRVVLVYPAEALNIAAANALLKMLEEPPEGVIFILVSHHWQRLLPTIRSRCQRFSLPKPQVEEALSWLEGQGVSDARQKLFHAGGAPLLDEVSADNVVMDLLLPALANPRQFDVGDIAKKLEKQRTAAVIDCLQKWISDCALYRETGTVRYYPDYAEAIGKQSQLDVWDYYDHLTQAKKQAHHPLNQRLVFEELFYRWLDVLRQPRKAH
jgi:DNA polymerase-3 subunit delta'